MAKNEENYGPNALYIDIGAVFNEDKIRKRYKRHRKQKIQDYM